MTRNIFLDAYIGSAEGGGGEVTIPTCPLKKNKCSDRSMEVKLPALLGNYDRPTDRRTDRVKGTKVKRQSIYRAGSSYPLNALWWRYAR